MSDLRAPARFALLMACIPVMVGVAQKPSTPDLARHFKGLDGTFVILNGATGEYIRHNATRAAQRFAPCSTFKIPHTAILLESGKAPDYGRAYSERIPISRAILAELGIVD